MNLHSQLPREPKARTSPSPEQSVSLTSAPNVSTEQLPWLCPTRKKQMFPLLLHTLLFCSEKKTVHPCAPQQGLSPALLPTAEASASLPGRNRQAERGTWRTPARHRQAARERGRGPPASLPRGQPRPRHLQGLWATASSPARGPAARVEGRRRHSPLAPSPMVPAAAARAPPRPRAAGGRAAAPERAASSSPGLPRPRPRPP